MSKVENILCKNCGKEHLVQNKYSCTSTFCSIKCQQEFIRNEKVLNGSASAKTLKRYLLDKYGNRCWTCENDEWLGKPISIELEHIDGNSENNELSNLSLICPNCHSQTATYKNRNKGNGRHSRRVRYAEGKSY